MYQLYENYMKIGINYMKNMYQLYENYIELLLMNDN